MSPRQQEQFDRMSYNLGWDFAAKLDRNGAFGELIDWYRSEPAVTGERNAFHEGIDDYVHGRTVR